MIKKSYAKINLALNIKQRYENGYHELDMIMVKVNLYDKLYFTRLFNDEIIITSNNSFLPTNSKNLVYQVIEKFKKVYKIKSGIKVHMIKTVPMQAGLGGGSSNAAVTLEAMDEMFGTRMSLEEKVEFIKDFGSDIPFFLYKETCRVSGLGDVIQPVENHLSGVKVILVKPFLGVSTKLVYKNVDMDTCDHPDIEKLLVAIKEDDYGTVVQNIKNSLQESAINIRPIIQTVMDKLNNLGVDVCMVSGSGTTIFALTKSEEVATTVRQTLNTKGNFVFITEFLKEDQYDNR